MRVCLIVFAIVLSGAARAECRWLDGPTAKQALTLLRSADSVVFGDRIGDGPPPQAMGVPAPSFTESWSGGPWYGLAVGDDRGLDIDRVYIRMADGSYRNLARLAGCAGSEAPERRPAGPAVLPADRSAAPVPDVPGERLVGLVDRPGISWMTPEAERRPITLYAAPSLSAPVHSAIRDWDALPSAEMGYEETAALVLEQDRGWYRIGVVDGPMPPDPRYALGWYRFGPGATAWLAPDDAGEFRSYEDILGLTLTYLGGRWDGLLSAGPDAASPVSRLSPDWRRGMNDPGEIAVRVLETREAGGRLWVRVAVRWPGDCGSVEPIAIAEGWVPGHTAGGEPVVGYYSRGC